jgi:hypothetical protein
MTADLAAWLLADDGPIAEDERVARAAQIKGHRDWRTEPGQLGELEVIDDAGRVVVQERAFVSEAGIARHIARWDPARVLAECAAKRAVVEAYRRSAEEHFTDYAAGEYAAWESAALALAQPYAGRPGWREEWRT